FEKKILKDIDRESTPIITQTDILDITYNKYIAVELNPHKQDDEIQVGKLKGEFSPLQAKRFFERYDLVEHQPNTTSGFSATLFQEKETQELIFAIRGTELSKISQIYKDVVKADLKYLALGKVPLEQYDDMIQFYETCALSYPQIKSSLTLTGHSLGGCLAQLLALSLCDDKDRNNIKALYTYNAPGASALYPPYFAIFDIAKYPHGSKRHFYVEIRDMLFHNTQGTHYEHLSKSSQFAKMLELTFDKCYNEQERYLDKVYGIELLNTGGHTLSGFIPQITRLNEIYYNKSRMPYYQMLLENFTKYIQCEMENKKKEKKEEKKAYKLSIQDSIYHCESSNNEYKNEWYMGSPISKLGIKLGLHQDNQYSDTTILHTITTAKGITGDHSIIPLTQTLYLYSYLLELDSNHNKVKDKSLYECIAYCNAFNKNLETYTNTFILTKINKGNKTQYNINTMHSSPLFFIAAINQLLSKEPEEIGHLPFILSLINSKIYNTITLRQDENKYNHPTIPKESIIDFIITLSNDGYYIKILDKKDFATLRKECEYINDINNVGYKACLAEYRNFIIIDKNNQTIENKDNLGSIYGYNSSVYRAIHNKWCEISLGSHCKSIQGLYFEGKATMIAVKA
ncbi:lipase family protein, partial [Helicobacter didelphidarum]|uniref:lipase family protein n=1 Tax=Helicobacter didelphidarum TaxID=2040648 RepID=UPI001FE4D4A7